MEKAERDRILSSMSQEESDAYRKILQEIRAEAKALPGEQIARRKQALAPRLAGLQGNVRLALTATTARDETGPKEGDIPPDFNLKRMGSEEKVRLSSFKGKRPVALIFGSYT
ncbi:MAG: hypothetical protein IIC99_01535 [Chloroflexi bacterium]|nr:hypothetical protein [Chloroflexota bacterium]